jgi:hypothetical protein
MIDGGNTQDVERRVVAQEGGCGEGDQNAAEIAEGVAVEDAKGKKEQRRRPTAPDRRP